MAQHPELFAEIEAEITQIIADADPKKQERCDECHEVPCSMFDYDHHDGWTWGLKTALDVVREKLGIPAAIEPPT
jgi:hypothetical protein